MCTFFTCTKTLYGKRSLRLYIQEMQKKKSPHVKVLSVTCVGTVFHRSPIENFETPILILLL